LKAINKEIQSRNIWIPHKTTGTLITVPGRVSPEEQQLITKLTWEIGSCKKQSAELHKEIKTTKETIEKKKRKLEELRSEQDCLAESGEYAIEQTLSNHGVVRNVYYGKCLIGPHIQKLLDRQVKVLAKLETKFVAVRDQTLESTLAPPTRRLSKKCCSFPTSCSATLLRLPF
jgi:hypothetical protein